MLDNHSLLSARALQDEEDNQCYDQKDSNVGSWSAKCGGKSSAGRILVSPVIAATAFPVSSIHNGLFQ